MASEIPTLNMTGTVSQNIEPVSFGVANPVSPLAGEGTLSIADMLQHMSDRMQNRLDIQAKIEGSRAGAAAGTAGIPPVMDDGTIRGEAFNLAARDALSTQYELNSRLQLAQYEEQYKTDPAGFTNASASWLKGTMPALQSYDPAVAGHFSAEYQLRAQDALNRIKDARNGVLRDQAQENVLKLQMSINDDLSTSAATLFNGNPDQVKSGLASMLTSAGKLVDTAHQFGPDGRPLFDAAQRVAFEKAAQDNIGRNIGMAYLNSQPSPIDAWHNWNSGNATVKIGDGQGTVVEMNMKDLLGPHIYAAVQKSFMENIRSDLALQGQIETEQDRQFKKSSDDTFATLSDIGINGKLTMGMVNDLRPHLEADKYDALLKIAKTGGASVSDGPTLSRLTTADIDGADIRGSLQTAYGQGDLSTRDYLELYQKNNERLNKGVVSPVAEGKDYVGASLGSLSKEMGFAQSASVGQAQGEYQVNVEDFITKNGRTPTTSEALNIGKDVVRRYSLSDIQNAMYALPLPELMPAAMKTDPNLKAADIAPIAQKTKDFFLKKYSGDIAAMEQDPEYRRESALLKDYYDRLTLKDQQNAGPASAAAK